MCSTSLGDLFYFYLLHDSGHTTRKKGSNGKKERSDLWLSFSLLYCGRRRFSLHTHTHTHFLTYSFFTHVLPTFIRCNVLFPGSCSQEEERLVRDLFRGYNKLIRPVQNMTQKVEVAFGLAFIQLINVVSWPTCGLFFICNGSSNRPLTCLILSPEWEEPNHEVQRLVASRLERLPASVGRGRLRRHQRPQIASG